MTFRPHASPALQPRLSGCFSSLSSDAPASLQGQACGPFHSSSISQSQYSASAACRSSRSSSALSVVAAHVSWVIRGVFMTQLCAAPNRGFKRGSL
jgi:hypothetical protein